MSAILLRKSAYDAVDLLVSSPLSAQYFYNYISAHVTLSRCVAIKATRVPTTGETGGTPEKELPQSSIILSDEWLHLLLKALLAD